MEWSEGYVADIDYTADFFREQSPQWLNLSCLLNGFQPVSLDTSFTYFELGCGQGVTLSILAASNPGGQFYGNDFMPSHIAAARQFATSAAQDNLTFLENSFSELANGAVADLPQFDFITLHGVYTWVNTENQAHIVKFINNYLKPGGIVYASYNAMPGWNTELPLKRLLLAHAALHPEKSPVQLAEATKFIEQFDLEQGGYFSNTPALKDMLALLKTRNPNYLAHEYLHDDVKPIYHLDIVKDFAAAKLQYVASADLCHATPSLYLNDEKMALVNAVSDDALRETLKDFFLNSYFRKDVFVRGARRLSAAKQTNLLCDLSLALLVPSQSIRYTDIKAGVTEVCINQPVYAPAFRTLDRATMTLGELAALPTLQKQSLGDITKVAVMMVISHQAVLYSDHRSDKKFDNAAAQRVNQLLSMEARYTDACDTFACPVAGNGIPMNIVERLVYMLLRQAGPDIPTDIMIDAVHDLLEHRQRRLRKDGKSIESEEENLAEIARHVIATREHMIAIWMRLGMLDPAGSATPRVDLPLHALALRQK